MFSFDNLYFDVSRVVLKGDTTEIDARFLGLTMESNGVRIVEPFDTSMKYTTASGKTNIHFTVSDVFMNFSFSILRLFLAVEEDVLAFLRTTSKKMTVVCSEFDKIGTIKYGEQMFVFWRPHAPPGYAILGDYLTPTLVDFSHSFLNFLVVLAFMLITFVSQ
nr:Vacuolar protein sorting-associated protein [Ipomoea batatas]